MCGRYARGVHPEDLVGEFRVDETEGEGPGADPGGAGADFNVAPTKTAPVVLERRPRPGRGADGGEPAVGAVDEEGQGPVGAAGSVAADGPGPGTVRWLRLLTWGLVPSWAKDRSVGNRMINARAGTVLDKPAYRRAAVSRRCLVPADGWYEWRAGPAPREARGRARKQPFYLRPLADGPIAFAGLYEFWRRPGHEPEDPRSWLTSFVIITIDAEPGLRAVHDRMPLVLPRDRWDAWLDPELRDPEVVRALLVPPAAGRFTAVAVSPLVNAVANNGPELIAPLPTDRLPGVIDPGTGEADGGGDTPLF